jgi:hypothetical protein
MGDVGRDFSSVTVETRLLLSNGLASVRSGTFNAGGGVFSFSTGSVETGSMRAGVG